MICSLLRNHISSESCVSLASPRPSLSLSLRTLWTLPPLSSEPSSPSLSLPQDSVDFAASLQRALIPLPLSPSGLCRLCRLSPASPQPSPSLSLRTLSTLPPLSSEPSALSVSLPQDSVDFAASLQRALSPLPLSPSGLCQLCRLSPASPHPPPFLSLRTLSTLPPLSSEPSTLSVSLPQDSVDFAASLQRALSPLRLSPSGLRRLCRLSPASPQPSPSLSLRTLSTLPPLSSEPSSPSLSLPQDSVDFAVSLQRALNPLPLSPSGLCRLCRLSPASPQPSPSLSLRTLSTLPPLSSEPSALSLSLPQDSVNFAASLQQALIPLPFSPSGLCRLCRLSPASPQPSPSLSLRTPSTLPPLSSEPSALSLSLPQDSVDFAASLQRALIPLPLSPSGLCRLCRLSPASPQPSPSLSLRTLSTLPPLSSEPSALSVSLPQDSVDFAASLQRALSPLPLSPSGLCQLCRLSPASPHPPPFLSLRTLSTLPPLSSEPSTLSVSLPQDSVDFAASLQRALSPLPLSPSGLCRLCRLSPASPQPSPSLSLRTPSTLPPLSSEPSTLSVSLPQDSVDFAASLQRALNPLPLSPSGLCRLCRLSPASPQPSPSLSLRTLSTLPPLSSEPSALSVSLPQDSVDFAASLQRALNPLPLSPSGLCRLCRLSPASAFSLFLPQDCRLCRLSPASPQPSPSLSLRTPSTLPPLSSEPSALSLSLPQDSVDFAASLQRALSLSLPQDSVDFAASLQQALIPLPFSPSGLCRLCRLSPASPQPSPSLSLRTPSTLPPLSSEPSALSLSLPQDSVDFAASLQRALIPLPLSPSGLCRLCRLSPASPQPSPSLSLRTLSTLPPLSSEPSALSVSLPQDSVDFAASLQRALSPLPLSPSGLCQLCRLSPASPHPPPFLSLRTLSTLPPLSSEPSTLSVSLPQDSVDFAASLQRALSPLPLSPSGLCRLCRLSPASPQPSPSLSLRTPSTLPPLSSEPSTLSVSLPQDSVDFAASLQRALNPLPLSPSGLCRLCRLSPASPQPSPSLSLRTLSTLPPLSSEPSALSVSLPQDSVDFAASLQRALNPLPLSPSGLCRLCRLSPASAFSLFLPQDCRLCRLSPASPQPSPSLSLRTPSTLPPLSSEPSALSLSLPQDSVDFAASLQRALSLSLPQDSVDFAASLQRALSPLRLSPSGLRRLCRLSPASPARRLLPSRVLDGQRLARSR